MLPGPGSLSKWRLENFEDRKTMVISILAIVLLLSQSRPYLPDFPSSHCLHDLEMKRVAQFQKLKPLRRQLSASDSHPFCAAL